MAAVLKNSFIEVVLAPEAVRRRCYSMSDCASSGPPSEYEERLTSSYKHSRSALRRLRREWQESSGGFSSSAASGSESVGCWSDDESTTASERSEAQAARSSHCVPRTVDFAERFQGSRMAESHVTTLMIRNMPNKCTQRQLIEELRRLQLGGTFDFLYVPMDVRTMSNVGYAFVNFLDAASARRAELELDGHQLLGRRCGARALKVSVAHLQGLEANLRHYEKSAVNHAKLKQRRPLVLPGGVLGAL